MNHSTRSGQAHPARETYDRQMKARQDAFLEAYPQCGNIRKAAEATGISPQAVYKNWTKDPEFMERLRLAQELHADYLEELALQKVERLESKDNLLHMMLLNGARPQKYKKPGAEPSNNVTITQITINAPAPAPEPQGQVVEGYPSSFGPAQDVATNPPLDHGYPGAEAPLSEAEGSQEP